MGTLRSSTVSSPSASSHPASTNLLTVQVASDTLRVLKLRCRMQAWSLPVAQVAPSPSYQEATTSTPDGTELAVELSSGTSGRPVVPVRGDRHGARPPWNHGVPRARSTCRSVGRRPARTGPRRSARCRNRPRSDRPRHMSMWSSRHRSRGRVATRIPSERPDDARRLRRLGGRPTPRVPPDDLRR